MLACLGPVVFNIVNDLQTVDEDSSTSFAKHDVMGAAPVYEATGEEEGSITLKGVLHPYFLTGSLQGLSALETARSGQVPLPFMRGDYRPVGWVLIKSITRADSNLDAGDGIGSEIEYTVKLLKVGTPGTGMAESILRLFL